MNTAIMESMSITITVLKRPYLSDRKPGIPRPKEEPLVVVNSKTWFRELFCLRIEACKKVGSGLGRKACDCGVGRDKSKRAEEYDFKTWAR